MILVEGVTPRSVATAVDYRSTKCSKHTCTEKDWIQLIKIQKMQQKKTVSKINYYHNLLELK